MSLMRNIQAGEQTIGLGRDLEGRYAQLDGERYYSLEQLADRVETWKLGKGIRAFAEISNYLLEGLDFHVLASKQAINRFKKTLIEPENQMDYGEFDLGELRKPFHEGDHVIFYLRQQDSGIPFKAKVCFPYRGDPKAYSYEPLPYQS